jgi:hypothetical protein
MMEVGRRFGRRRRSWCWWSSFSGGAANAKERRVVPLLV